VLKVGETACIVSPRSMQETSTPNHNNREDFVSGGTNSPVPTTNFSETDRLGISQLPLALSSL
jgi:hypothetical protein